MKVESEMKKTTIFIGFTPYHSFFAKPIIESTEGNIWCVFTKGWPATNKKYRKIGFFKPGNTLIYKLRYIISMFGYSFRIRKLLNSSNDVTVYMPHPSNLLTNYVFFSNKVKEIHIYEDGILNYYDADANLNKISITKKIMALLLLIPYKEYKGHLAGYSTGRISKVFLSSPKLSVAKDMVQEIVELQPRKKKLSLVKNVVLFLDQNTSKYFSPAERNRYVAQVLRAMPKKNFTYFYKGHHEYNHIINGMNEVDKKLRNEPAEVVVGCINPEIVISFYSSALINIKRLYPEIKCYYLGADRIKVMREGEEENLSLLFDKAGVLSLVNEDSIND
ncbi:MAG: polysialyltransferase family glycosyltransferase [Halomonas sp.]|nr:polysialyltransferase family glycosyltransferase [Halomonas sp.]